MLARDQMRAMLDELMGTCTNGDDSENSIRYDDLNVCRAFLLGCCPHDILSATKIDLGSCDKIHNLAFKADYEMQISNGKEMDYEVDAVEVLERFVARADMRKELMKRKLVETQDEISEETQENLSKINAFDEQIGTKLAQAEELGNSGQVDESIKLLHEVDALKKKKDDVLLGFRNSMPSSTYQQQKLRVCEICAASLGIDDNDKRLADHFGGKLHIGFMQIRQKLDELREKTKDNVLVLKQGRLNRWYRSSSKRSRSRDRRRSRSASRHKSSRRSRNRSQSRLNSRSRHSKSHRKRSRSDSRNRYRRSRSRDKHRKHKTKK